MFYLRPRNDNIYLQTYASIAVENDKLINLTQVAAAREIFGLIFPSRNLGFKKIAVCGEKAPTHSYFFKYSERAYFLNNVGK